MSITRVSTNTHEDSGEQMLDLEGKEKSYTSISKEGIKNIFFVINSWQRETGSFKRIPYPLVVINRTEAVYEFNPDVVEIKPKENYKALFRKLL